MQIKKGTVSYQGRNDWECLYGEVVVDEKPVQYFFMDNGNLPNGNFIASTRLVEAIDRETQANNVGLIDFEGNILIPFENKSIKVIPGDILLVERSEPQDENVLEAVRLKKDPLAATKLVSTPAAIKEKMNQQMGPDGRYLFNDQFSEASIFDFEGKNLINDEYFSFVGMADSKLYFTKNTVDAGITEYSILPAEVREEKETTEEEINVESVVEDREKIENIIDTEVEKQEQELNNDDNTENDDVSEMTEEVVEEPNNINEDVVTTEDIVTEEVVSNEINSENVVQTEENVMDNIITDDVSVNDMNVVNNEATEENVVNTDISVVQDSVVEDVNNSLEEQNDVVMDNGVVIPVVEESPVVEEVVNNISVEEVDAPIVPIIPVIESANSEVSDEIKEENMSEMTDEVVNESNEEIEESFVTETEPAEENVSINNEVNEEENFVNEVEADGIVTAEEIENELEETEISGDLSDFDLEENDLLNASSFEVDNIVDEDTSFESYMNKYTAYDIPGDDVVTKTAEYMSKLIDANREQQEEITKLKDFSERLKHDNMKLVNQNKSQKQAIDLLTNRNKKYEPIVAKAAAWKEENQALKTEVLEQRRVLEAQERELKILRAQVGNTDKLLELIKDADDLFGKGSYTSTDNEGNYSYGLVA